MAKGIKRLIINSAAAVLPARCKHLLFHFSLAIMDEQEKAHVRHLYNMTTLRWTLQNLARLGQRLEQVIDVGAYEGEWTEEVLAVYPDAKVLMVEAQPAKEPFLRGVVERHPSQVQYALTLAGPEPRPSVEFYEMELGSSVLYENTKADRRKVSRPMTTLDLLAGEHRMERVDLLKLDVQGYELEVLNGAAALLLRADLVLLEVSLLPIIQGAPLMPEVIAFMRARNFVPYDICTHMRRPSDLTLWQVDMLFARADSPLLVNCAL